MIGTLRKLHLGAPVTQPFRFQCVRILPSQDVFHCSCFSLSVRSSSSCRLMDWPCISSLPSCDYPSTRYRSVDLRITWEQWFPRVSKRHMAKTLGQVDFEIYFALPSEERQLIAYRAEVGKHGGMQKKILETKLHFKKGHLSQHTQPLRLVKWFEHNKKRACSIKVSKATCSAWLFLVDAVEDDAVICHLKVTKVFQ